MIATPPSESLPQLEEELTLILQYLDSENPSERQVAEETFQDFLPRLESKIDAYIEVIKWREALAEYQESEAKRINALAHSNQQTVNWLKHKLQVFMETRVEQLGDKGKKLEGKLSKVSLCHNGGKPPIWINPELTKPEDFPPEYVEYRWYLDKTKLADEAIDYGEVRSSNGTLLAKVLPRGKHIRIS